MLEKKLIDFMMPLTTAVTMVKKEPEWEGVAQLKGSPRCEKLVKIKMGQLHIQAVMKRKEMFKEMLPEYLSILLPSVSLDDTVESCLAVIKDHADFDEYLNNVKNWPDNTDYLYSFSEKIPFAFVQNEGEINISIYMYTYNNLHFLCLAAFSFSCLLKHVYVIHVRLYLVLSAKLFCLFLCMIKYMYVYCTCTSTLHCISPHICL